MIKDEQQLFHIFCLQNEIYESKRSKSFYFKINKIRIRVSDHPVHTDAFEFNKRERLAFDIWVKGGKEELVPIWSLASNVLKESSNA